MLLAHLLRQAQIDCVVLERRDRDYVQHRVRAGVLEPATVELLTALGLGERVRREGLVHSGVNLAFDGELLRIDLTGLTGRAITVYGQQEVMKDLFDAAQARDVPIRWEAEDLVVDGVDGEQPTLAWRDGGGERRLEADFVVGCDGSHGVTRGLLPADVAQTFEREYPFGWLGILADVAPCGEELVYASHPHGFALASMRSPTRSRYYIQCGLEERLEDWPDERIWDELCLRLGPQAGGRVVRGPSFEKSVAPLRSAVTEPMQHGRLFLAGDAAHIVPPTGAKGLNLAATDALMLSSALSDFYRAGSEELLAAYSQRALARVWKAERFSWWFTGLTHRFPQTSAFERKIQLAELAYLRGSRAAQTALAENYVGLPLEA